MRRREFIAGILSLVAAASVHVPASAEPSWRHVVLSWKNRDVVDVFLDNVRVGSLADVGFDVARTSSIGTLSFWYNGQDLFSDAVVLHGGNYGPEDFGEMVDGVWQPKKLELSSVGLAVFGMISDSIIMYQLFGLERRDGEEKE